MVNVRVGAGPVQREDPSATVVVTWECPYLTGKPHVDIVKKFSVVSNPNVGDQVVLTGPGARMEAVYTGLDFEQEYCFKVAAKGCRLRSPAVRSDVILVPSHVGSWLRVRHCYAGMLLDLM